MAHPEMDAGSAPVGMTVSRMVDDSTSILHNRSIKILLPGALPKPSRGRLLLSHLAKLPAQICSTDIPRCPTLHVSVLGTGKFLPLLVFVAVENVLV